MDKVYEAKQAAAEAKVAVLRKQIEETWDHNRNLLAVTKERDALKSRVELFQCLLSEEQHRMTLLFDDYRKVVAERDKWKDQYDTLSEGIDREFDRYFIPENRQDD